MHSTDVDVVYVCCMCGVLNYWEHPGRLLLISLAALHADFMLSICC